MYTRYFSVPPAEAGAAFTPATHPGLQFGLTPLYAPHQLAYSHPVGEIPLFAHLFPPSDSLLLARMVFIPLWFNSSFMKNERDTLLEWQSA